MTKPVIKLICESEVSNYARLMVNDEMIPFTKANIELKPGNFVKLEIETYANLIDITALQENTQLVVKEMK